MKEKILTGILTVILALNCSGPALASAGSVQEWAYRDAEQAVISGHLVSEEDVRRNGEKYTSAFLTAFAEVSQSYEQFYRQGVNDGLHGQSQLPNNSSSVVTIAYQRGYDRGMKLRTTFDNKNSQPTVPGDVPAQPVPDPGATPEEGKADDQEYEPQTPTPDQAKFISRIAKSAQKVGMEYDLYPSVIIAQAALESNWGASDLAQKPYHNLFGVKGDFNGRSVRQPTIEYTKEGKSVKIQDFFRWYENDYQSLCDYAETLNDPLYIGVHRGQAANFREATHALLGKYATDPHYDRKLNRVIQTYQLTKYDHQAKKGLNEKQSVKALPITESTAHKSQAASLTKHRLSWLSVAGGVGSAGALGLLRRFAFKWLATVKKLFWGPRLAFGDASFRDYSVIFRIKKGDGKIWFCHLP